MILLRLLVKSLALVMWLLMCLCDALRRAVTPVPQQKPVESRMWRDVEDVLELAKFK